MEGSTIMPATTNKQQLLNHVFTLLKKRYDPADEIEKRPILEHLIYAICREGTTSQIADEAFKNLLAPSFIDWNEVRVSTVQEIEEALGKIPNPGERAQQIIGVLQEWFEMTYSFDMEEVAETAKKKGLKEGAKKIGRLKEVKDHDFIVAWVTQHGLGGHAIPLDSASLRVLRRLGVLDTDTDDIETLRSSIEHYVPKARGVMFTEVISQLAQEICVEETPKCSICPLHNDCPTGIENLRNATPEPKPRKSR
jgi:endonuclease III